MNSSFGVTGGGHFDSTDPINQATKRLHAAGITVVFSDGNSGTNADGDPPGASDCSTRMERAGAQLSGACKTNPYSVAPWVISAAGGRKDAAGDQTDQHLSSYSARGDPDPQTALSGEQIDYSPTLTAPGTNVRSVRDPTGDAQAVALTGEPDAIPPPPGGESFDAFYQPFTGTSMAAPALTGAVAVIQSAAKARLGRLLSPAEVEAVVTETARPIGGVDALWDFPCGAPALPACGEANPALGNTGEAYERWQVGAGYLDVAGAIARVRAMPARRASRRSQSRRSQSRRSPSRARLAGAMADAATADAIPSRSCR